MIADREPVSVAPVCYAIVPYREQPAVKTRLADQLTLEQRLTLARSMLSRVLHALLASPPVTRMLLVGDAAPPAEFAGIARLVHLSTKASLNESVALAAELARASGANELLIAHADLPTLEPADILRLVAAGRALPGPARAALASCQHRDGTNLLWLSSPAPIEFGFGPGSRARHLQRLAAVACPVAEVPAIRDVDSRDDLAGLAGLLPG
jgi:2-phospho-L-lactate guanylyltransferase